MLTPDWTGDVAFDPAVAPPHLAAPVLMIAGEADRTAAALAGDRAEPHVLPGHHCASYASAPRAAAAALVGDFPGRRL